MVKLVHQNDLCVLFKVLEANELSLVNLSGADISNRNQSEPCLPAAIACQVTDINYAVIK